MVAHSMTHSKLKLIISSHTASEASKTEIAVTFSWHASIFRQMRWVICFKLIDYSRSTKLSAKTMGELIKRWIAINPIQYYHHPKYRTPSSNLTIVYGLYIS
jgi:hypothetical protein